MVSDVFLREANIGDIDQVFLLSSHPSTRLYSINKTIAYDEHVKWFHRIIADSNTRLYIITNENKEFIGQIRYDLTSDGNAVISISLADMFKQKGIATHALRLSHKQIAKDTGIKYVTAYINKDNVSSIKLFENVGYQYTETNKDILRYEYKLLENGE